ncbi:MAG: nitrous oxide reductase family maturation protein NosD [Flavobacteriaceae bacterium CG_4_9_14_0_8_um_filter_34_30]|nr:MAG: nitrous oxide reductase family maturation protein NosD [Flavobacteriaceae bacterium CG_4_10_14_0_8_um_filter_34_31]PJC07591.1 MAG: nitrous oxide reductase family maturation protein NosD [Flavobacteriaceae bacterium CG_4_9_14_0_8_um_filter_34_30]
MKLLFSVLLFLLSFQNFASTITVCKECKVSTIKEAIEQAIDGDTILIKKGIYKEHGTTIIDKSITIIGEGNPVIDGEMKGTIFSIQATNFSIEGLHIINVGKSYLEEFAAILIVNSKDFQIKNNLLEYVYYGVLIEKSSNGIISNNTISSNAKEEAHSGNGVHLWHSENMTVSNNHITKMRDGVYFEFVNNSTVSKNTCKNNLRYGLHFMFSNDDAYLDNIFESNGAGVAVMFSKRIKMYRNLFKKNWGAASYGLLLKEINDAELKNNIFEDNTIGIHADGTNRILFTENDFLNNGYAIKVLGACYNNTFSKNNFLSNSFDLAYSGNINENVFDQNYWSSYTGYDLDKNGIGDVPYRPVKLFSYLVNKTPEAIILLRSLFIDIIDFSEKVSPIFTPADLVDSNPQMKKILW